MSPSAATAAGVVIGRLEAGDLEDADGVFRLAFGTALGLQDPRRFAEGAETVRTRWLADPECAFKAEHGGRLVGCAFITRWGSHALFGPLAVHPEYWDRGVGHLLWGARLPLLDRWGVTHASLFTRPDPRNIHLYQKFGFWPGALTALTAKQLGARPGAAGWARLADSAPPARDRCLESCRRLTGSIAQGLDLEREIEVLARQGIGDTILLDEDGSSGFAVCHAGAGSEAGPGALYVKFAAVPGGSGVERRFARLLDACEEYAATRGLDRLLVGVSTARREAYAALLARSHRVLVYGVAMHRPDDPAYDREGVWVLDDRR